MRVGLFVLNEPGRVGDNGSRMGLSPRGEPWDFARRFLGDQEPYLMDRRHSTGSFSAFVCDRSFQVGTLHTMGITDLFKKRDQSRLRNHLKNVVALANADGRLEESEMALIRKAATTAGVTQEELDALLAHADEIHLTVSGSVTQRIEQFYDLILMMLVDGEIEVHESQMCLDVAAILGFEDSMVKSLIGDVIESIHSELDPSEVIARMQAQVAGAK